MEDSSCNKAAPELLDSCYVWIYSMLGWNKFLSAHCVCGCLCYIPPGVTLYHETVCNYVFTRPSPLSLFVSFWFFVCVRAISPSSDPGLSGDAGPGARGVCQPPLPRRRHPESQTPLVEERHGPAAQILQTALSHRWGVFKCCRQRMRSGRYCLPHLIGAVLQTNSAAVRQHCRDLFFFFKPRQCRNNKSSKFKLVLAPFFFFFLLLLKNACRQYYFVVLSVYLYSVRRWWNRDCGHPLLLSSFFCTSDKINTRTPLKWMKRERGQIKWNILCVRRWQLLIQPAFFFKDTLSISEGRRAEWGTTPSFYGLVLIKGEFIGCVWVITCGNSLLSTLRHSNMGGSARFTDT